MNHYPEKLINEEQLEELLSKPSNETTELMERLDGDLLFLGIAGKIGPSLAHMAARACRKAGVSKKIIGVSRFQNRDEQEKIKSFGIETIKGDLLDRRFLECLPKCKNVFFLAGMKFGSVENLALTWAMNTYLPAFVAETFHKSTIVAYSTGCVYPLVPVTQSGSLESDDPDPVGEYAQSCLGRERMFQYGSTRYNTPVAIIRLNYAVELRYGVLVDIAQKVFSERPVDLSMGYFNAIWQGDANNLVIRSLNTAQTPAWVANMTGTENLSVRATALQFGQLFGKEVKFTGQESPTALLSNSGKITRLMGAPETPIDKVIKWTAEWIKDNHRVLGKPTHFEVRDGKY